MRKAEMLSFRRLVVCLFSLILILHGPVGCVPIDSSQTAISHPTTTLDQTTTTTDAKTETSRTTTSMTTKESSLETSETSSPSSSESTSQTAQSSTTQSGTTKPTTTRQTTTKSSVTVTATTTVRPTTGTTTTTAPPAPKPTQVPTTAPPTPTTAAVPSDFPAKNYGTFFRDDYGKNSQLVTSEDGSVTLDTGSSPYGVALIRIDPNLIPDNIRVKVLVIIGDLKYQYDIVKRGSFQGIPLQGSGSCSINVFKQIDASGTSLAQVMTHQYQVSLASSLKPYTAASILSDFSRGSASVRQAASLCSGISTQTGKVDAVYNWIVANIKYDTALSKSITTDKTKYETYLPDPDRTFSARKGICYDYASLMCAMLRSQGIPTRMIKGLVFGSSYHAWNEVFFEGYGWVVVASFRWKEINGTGWVLFDSTFAASGMTSEQISKTTHTKQRVY